MKSTFASRVFISNLFGAALLINLTSCNTTPAKPEMAKQEKPAIVRHYEAKTAFVSDTVLHLELGEANALEYPGIYRTPMLADSTRSDASHMTGASVASDSIRLIRQDNGCFGLYASPDTDKTDEYKLTELCVKKAEKNELEFTITPETTTHIYGLGQQFFGINRPDGDLTKMRRRPGTTFGNRMVKFDSGSVGNTQIPVAYFVNGKGLAHAVFFDNIYGQTWNFRSNTRWKITSQGDAIRLFVITGKNLAEIRSEYLELTGKPPVPPRSAFGLWVSEFGYDNWGEVDSTLQSLRQSHFPVDGLVMDLQWFGGIESYSDYTSMGTLSWDRLAFPRPEEKIEELRKQGTRLILIEESYVGKGLEEHKKLAEQGFLVRKCAPPCDPAYLATKSWWGKGGMIDWSNPEAGQFWHTYKRQPLADMGIVGHWTDLGEPEQYYGNGWYHGYEGPDIPAGKQTNFRHGHAANHNLYNFHWSESIFNGYQAAAKDNAMASRPFVLTRSGTSGSQRFGVAMWSGDIISRFSSFATQANVQMHMAMSGIDYFGSDIGGFHRGPLRAGNERLTDLYTQWFAASALQDIPLRPHADNLCNCNETSPNLVGDVASNRENLRLRYQLIPYLYSLAHRAHRTGEAVFPPLTYHYPSDLEARKLSRIKMIGRDLLFAIVAKEGATTTSVYLPAGQWFDFRHHSHRTSQGEWTEELPLYSDGLFQLPLYAKAGAIIPMMQVGENTLNSEGLQANGELSNQLRLRIYPDRQATEFTLYEDDGRSQAYTQGEVRETRITQHELEKEIIIGISEAKGSFQSAPTERDLRLELVTGTTPGAISLNGNKLKKQTAAELAMGEPGWGETEGMVRVNLGVQQASRNIKLVIER